ncbi:ATP synthase subunit I [Calderihabitans maritimus]|uniref:ATP synthase subunit I n=1 Tax=Calderihabitans maritimus TaxID=1246530 RepID=A0A1Z5HX20_9FIRM|nr:ATP synthase subunit I [Calderihabitans maritimus]GAW93830.1 hypothetical protein Tph_c27440 [Calderihabitans maritimus]
MNLQELFVGLAFGAVVSIFNHQLIVRLLPRLEGLPVDRAKAKLWGRYLVRYGINFLVLFAVYKRVWLLTGTALGLTAMQKYLAVKYFFKRKG